MNFLGLDVRDLDLPTFFFSVKLFYLVAFAGWAAWMWHAKKIRGLWVPTAFALLCWFMATYPLQRIYGLAEGTDRQRNLWWCATAAAGNAPWESGVVGGVNLEPTWSFLVAVGSFFDPGRVWTIYPFLPALVIGALGLSLAFTFFRSGSNDGGDPATSRNAAGALWVTFFVLLAPSGPLDFLGPYRGFWQKNFLVKPNHVLAIVLVPVVLWLLAGKWTKRRGLLAAAVLAAVGWVFVVPWALVCWGLFFYAMGMAVRRPPHWKRSAMRLVTVGASSLVLLGPLLVYLLQNFPVLHFAPGAFPEDPLRSVWGDRLSPTHSLVLLVTFDLGLSFFLAVYGMWTAWRSDDRFQHMWLGLATGGYLAWAANIVLLYVGQARESDELYYFVVFHTAIFAGLGMAKLIDAAAHRFSWDRARSTAVVLLFLFPLTTAWWWDPPETDTHFQLALEPVPERLIELGEWLRLNSHGSDIVLTGTQTAIWIPALAGRRVLRTGIHEPDSDLYRDERAVLFPENLEEGRRALEKTGVDYVIYDRSLGAEHRLVSDHLDRHPLLELVHVSGPYKIYRAAGPDPSS